MENNFRKEFKWVIKVLESCKTEDHLYSVENLFENLIAKHKKQINCNGIDCIYEDLIREEFKNYLTIKSRTVIF